ncbi:MAG: urease accessory protein UreF [Alphaproteobacteria bacterium]
MTAIITMTITGTGTNMTTAAEAAAALRLQTWLSPAFPIGGFSYSHGLEQAVELGFVRDRDTAAGWIATVLRHGSGCSDAILFAAAHRVAPMGDLEPARLGAAFRPTGELALEAGQQGGSFLIAVRAAWPDPRLDRWAEALAADGTAPVLPVAVATACAFQGIPLPVALPLYLQAFAAGLVVAAVKLVPLGQTDGLRVQAALEPVVADTAAAALAADPDDLGSATPMLDLCSMLHETQYTRLFRS